MTCLNPEQFIRLLSPESDSAEFDSAAAASREHLQQCPSCRQAFARWQQDWALLGSWCVDERSVNVVEDVLSRVDAEAAPANLQFRQHAKTRLVLLQRAAAILLAAGLGLGSAAWLASPTANAVEPPAVHASDVRDALGLSGFGVDSASGLVAMIEAGVDMPGSGPATEAER